MTEATRREFPALPFEKIRGMRNLVAHDYARVDFELVWRVASENVPVLVGENVPVLVDLLDEFLSKSS